MSLQNKSYRNFIFIDNYPQTQFLYFHKRRKICLEKRFAVCGCPFPNDRLLHKIRRVLLPIPPALKEVSFLNILLFRRIS